MRSEIINGSVLPFSVSACLPERVNDEISRLVGIEVEEVRLRSGGHAWVSSGGRNIRLGTLCSKEEIEECLYRFCGGSVYAQADSINNGYVNGGGGVRVGVGGKMTHGGVRDICSVVIRIPRRVRIDVEPLEALLQEWKYTKGLLFFSPPLGGKTSILRELAIALASGSDPKHTVVVDSRGELGYSMGDICLCIDILDSYPRRLGLEIAARSMSAQAVVCDEIGDGDADAISQLHGGGVPLIASAHASTLNGLLSRRGIDTLHRQGIFGAYVELCRHEKPPYKIHLWENCGVS